MAPKLVAALGSDRRWDRGTLKNPDVIGMLPGLCRIRGLVKRSLLVACMFVAHNLHLRMVDEERLAQRLTADSASVLAEALERHGVTGSELGQPPEPSHTSAAKLNRRMRLPGTPVSDLSRISPEIGAGELPAATSSLALLMPLYGIVISLSTRARVDAANATPSSREEEQCDRCRWNWDR